MKLTRTHFQFCATMCANTIINLEKNGIMPDFQKKSIISTFLNDLAQTNDNFKPSVFTDWVNTKVEEAK